MKPGVPSRVQAGFSRSQKYQHVSSLSPCLTIKMTLHGFLSQSLCAPELITKCLLLTGSQLDQNYFPPSTQTVPYFPFPSQCLLPSQFSFFLSSSLPILPMHCICIALQCFFNLNFPLSTSAHNVAIYFLFPHLLL